MKILSIRLKNLASLAGEQFIDFEAEPLDHAGLIAIVGKTGAGKSTILDAMCLALFNKIPRLKDSDGKLNDIDGSELATNSPLTVLRRGTGHGFAELCFVAQDQKRYLARWEIKRARESASGKLQSVQRYLKCLTDGTVIADKTKAVDQHIVKITQLSFEQFTRAVLLAQSEVTAFLKARDNERGELLEYLTNSSIFTKIGQLAFEKTKEVSQQRKQLENFLGHLELLPADEVQALQQQFIHAQQTQQNLEQKKVELQQQKQWYEQKHKLDTQIGLKQRALHDQQLSFDSLHTERQLITQLAVFAEIRPHVFQQQQIMQQQQTIAVQIAQKQSLFSEQTVQFEQEKNQYQQVEQALLHIQEFEQQYQTEFAQLRQYVQEREYIAKEYKNTKGRITALELKQQPLLQQQQSIEIKLKQLTEQQQRITTQLDQSIAFTALDQGIQVHIQQLQQFITQYQSIETRIGSIATAQQQLNQNRHTLSELENTSGSLSVLAERITVQQQRKEQQLLQLTKLEAVEGKINSYIEAKHDCETNQIALNESIQNQQQLEQQARQQEQLYLAAKTEREKLQQILQQQRLLHAENIEHLRQDLQANEPCMVCGSKVHPYRENEDLLSHTLYELQQQQELQALQQEQQHSKLWQEQQQQLTQQQVKLEQLQHAAIALKNKFDRCQNELIQSLKTAQIQLDLALEPSKLNLAYQQLFMTAVQDKQRLEQQLQHDVQSHKQHVVLQQQIQNLTHQLAAIQQLQQQVQSIVTCLNKDEQNEWTLSSLTLAQITLATLQQRAQCLEQLQALTQQQNDLTQQLKMHQMDLNYLTQQQSELNQQLQQIESKGKQNTDDAHHLLLSMDQTVNVKANEWLIQHESKKQQMQQQYQISKKQFEQARQQFEQYKNDLNQLIVQQTQNQDTLQHCQNTIDTWSLAHPTLPAAQFSTLLAIEATQEQSMRSKLLQVERQLNEAKFALDSIQTQLNDHMQLQSALNEEDLNVQIENVQQQLQQQTEQRDHYKLQLEMQQQNKAKQEKYAAEIQAVQVQEQRWNKISSLIGDAKGKEFRDYAQQYHLDILLEYANQQLSMLSQRYTLKRLENSLSLAIVDHDMDGEIRSVASLSGGESFLTALAISLAIANMASGSMKIESLFIDEGFGTLDASSLHMVMNALDQLQSQGRKVILISHIQEMHERIPVQIQVQPIGAGSSKIEVVG